MLTFLTRSALMDGCCEGSSDYGQRDSSARLQQLSSLLPGQNFILTKTGVDMCWSVFAGRYLWADQRVEPLDGLGVADDSVHAVHIQHNLPQSWGQRESTRITLNLCMHDCSGGRTRTVDCSSWLHAIPPLSLFCSDLQSKASEKCKVGYKIEASHRSTSICR